MKRELFQMPAGIYLDGNSLGLMPHAAREAVTRRLDEWQNQAVSGWESWFGLSEQLSPALAKLVGAQPHEVIATGSITTNLHSILATLYKPTGARRHLLATALDFPSDVYALQSWAERSGNELRLIPSRDGRTLHPDDILAAFTPDIALALLPTVLYRSGQLLDMAALTKAAQERGLLIGWDAAHSVGCIPHDFHAIGADFAVWCHYKYVNAGPGAPGGLFMHEKHHGATPGLRGWWGNNKHNQFEMALTFRPAAGANAYQLGTPPILSLAALEGALSVFEAVSLTEIRQESLALTDYFIAQADQHLPEMRLVTPRQHESRGGHVSLAHPDAAALSSALRARQIIPDFRQPDILRMSPVALYNTKAEIEETVRVLRYLLDTEEYKEEQKGGLVT